MVNRVLEPPMWEGVGDDDEDEDTEGAGGSKSQSQSQMDMEEGEEEEEMEEEEEEEEESVEYLGTGYSQVISSSDDEEILFYKPLKRYIWKFFMYRMFFWIKLCIFHVILVIYKARKYKF